MKRRNSHKANPLASIPVIVMLVMAPLSMDGKQPVQSVPIDSARLTELVATVNANAPKVYTEPQAPENEAPLGIQYLAIFKAQKILPCYGNKQPAKLLFTTGRDDKVENRVSEIYYIEDSYDKKQFKEPPCILSLIYHDLGEKSFLGIKIIERFRPINGDYVQKTFISEVKLNDEAAQYLINFLTNDTKF